MSYIIKNIITFFDLSKEGLRVLAHAAKLAHRFDAHLVGVFATICADKNYHERFAVGRDAVSDVAQRHQDMLRALREEAKDALDKLSRQYDLDVELRAIDPSQSSESLSEHPLFCDLAIAGLPQPPGLPPEKTPEKMLVKTGVPGLIVPTVWDGEEIGTRVIVAWNGSRVARRAISDALPILVTAQAVRILIVDAEKYDHGPEPGAELAVYLTRHGVNADVLQVSSQGLPVEKILVERAKEFDANLIVIGAYSRSRLIESVLGGVTKSLLSEVPLPLFVSH